LPQVEHILERPGSYSEKVIDSTDGLDRTALHYAAGRGRLEVVDLLLNKGARVDATDSANQTALHKAAASGTTSVCRTLALALADTNAVCNGGVTPLMLAAKSANLECAQVQFEGSPSATGCVVVLWAREGRRRRRREGKEVEDAEKHPTPPNTPTPKPNNTLKRIHTPKPNPQTQNHMWLGLMVGFEAEGIPGGNLYTLQLSCPQLFTARSPHRFPSGEPLTPHF
jgi:hypothetical protein